MPDAPRDTTTDLDVHAPPALVTRPSPPAGADEPDVTTPRRDVAPTPGDAERRRSRTTPALVPVTKVAMLLIAVHGAVTAMRMDQGWWWQDDLNILASVAGHPLTPQLLLQDYNGHVQPGTWLMAWLVTHLAPYAWWPAMVVQTALVVATDVALFLLLRRLFGSRPAILVALAAHCASGVTLSATLWWAAAMQWIPTALSMALALYFHVGYEIDGRKRDAAASIAAILGGLFFFERALAIVPVLALVSVLYLTPGPSLQRPGRALRRRPLYWAMLAVLTIAYVPFFFSRTDVISSPSSSLADIVALGREMLFYNIVPGLLGGPLDWYANPGGVASIATPPRSFLHVSWLVCLVVVVGSMVARRGAWRAWLLSGSFLVVNVVLLASTRGGIMGPTVGRDGRYSADLALLVVVCAALAWLPLRLTSATGEPVDDPTGTQHGDGDPRPDEDDDVAGRWSARRPRVAAAFVYATVVALTVTGLVTGAHYMRSWKTNPSEAYVRNLRADLAASGSDVVMFDKQVPKEVMIPAFGPAAQLSNFTRPFDHRPRFVAWAPAVRVVDDTGHLRPPAVKGMDVTLPRPVCGKRAVTVRLPGSVMEWAWKVHVSYTATAPTPATITVGSGRVDVELEKGRNEVYASFIGGGPTMKISGLAPGARVCVTGAAIGDVVPAP